MQTEIIETLVHLGAGKCSELDYYMSLQPKHMLLVEGDPEIADALLERTANLAQVVVENSVIAGQSGESSFIRYNLPGTGALHEATSLLETYPGLRKTHEFSVSTVAPSS